MSWKLTENDGLVHLEHGEIAQTIATFTDSYGKLYIIFDDHELVLVCEDGRFLYHWPVELVKAMANYQIPNN